MARISTTTIWDRTTEVLRGRGGMLAGIAATTLVVPAALRDGLALLGVGSGAAVLAMVVALVALVAVVLGHLALVAAATMPATLRGDAYRIAARRLLPAVGIYVLLGLAALLLIAPIIAAAVALHPELANAQVDPEAAARLGGPFALLALVIGVLALIVSVRLLPLNAVIVNERRGLRSLTRTWALTRGSGWRIAGFLVLAIIVLAVACVAVLLVAGLLFRVALGEGGQGWATWLTRVAVGLVTAGYSVVISAFQAQFYVAARAAEDEALGGGLAGMEAGHS